jgi:hypothetical protein
MCYGATLILWDLCAFLFQTTILQGVTKAIPLNGSARVSSKSDDIPYAIRFLSRRQAERSRVQFAAAACRKPPAANVSLKDHLSSRGRMSPQKSNACRNVLSGSIPRGYKLYRCFGTRLVFYSLRECDIADRRVRIGHATV